MKNYNLFLFCILVLVEPIVAQSEIEEVTVSASFLQHSLNAIDDPSHVIDGEAIASNGTQSLGESIDGLLGVASSDFGSAVGQPIIRGMSGSRVKILTNGMVVRDVSGLGSDHANDVDLNNIQQIEIVRGPASLLYANGTIGGIVNIVDNSIARKDFEISLFKLGGERQSVNDGYSSQLSYQGNLSGLNFSAALSNYNFNNFNIPKGAILHTEEEDHDGEENHDEEEGLGYLANSDYENSAYKIGVSKAGDWGYLGMSISDIESLYGIPFHGGDDHEEELTDHGVERIITRTESNAVNLDGAYVLSQGAIDRVEYFYQASDYALIESHEDGDEPPTIFSNDAHELGFRLNMGSDTTSQTLAMNISNEKIAIAGEEAFLPNTNSDEMTLGYYARKDLSFLHADFGLRHEKVARKNIDEAVNIKENNTSAAFTLGRYIGDSLDIELSYASVARVPSAVELFMEGPHLATQRYEVGNHNLTEETSNNTDLTFTFYGQIFFSELALFKNRVDDYVYLLDGTDTVEGLIRSVYSQRDAELKGYEFELGRSYQLANGDLTISYGRDAISGKFNDGSYIPRIVPARDIYEVSYKQDDLTFVATLKNVHKQNDINELETATDGFSMLDISILKSLQLSEKSILTVSVFGKNLLDEIARNHSSFVKNEIPLPGRNLGIRFNMTF